jgi:stress response protein SCP2
LEETNAGVDPYQLVLDGKWTWEKMTELSANALSDLDGNAVYDSNDRYGMDFFNNNNNTNQFIVGSGEVLTGRDAVGNPVININQENMITVLDKLIAMVHANDACYYGTEADIRKMFIDGKTMFHNYWLYYAQTQYAAQMDAYGILPTPKASEEQENYHTWIQGGMHIYGIPTDVKNIERTSILTEAFAAETYASLLPQYYEVVLKNRYFKDEASSKMMDIMYDSVEFDFVRLFDGQIGILAATTGPVTSGKNTFSSLIKASLKVGEKKLATMLDAVHKNING